MNRHRFALALSLIALGCSERTPPPIVLPAVAPEIARLPLADRLAREAASRSSAGLRVERVQQALAGQGIALARWKQVLASPVGAHFCMAGVTGSGVTVAVCEYGSPGDAERGLAGSRARFDRLIPGRALLRNGATLLTLGALPSPTFRAETERLSAIFAAL